MNQSINLSSVSERLIITTFQIKKTKNFHKVKSELRTERKHLHRNKKNNFAKRKKLKLKKNKIYKKHTKKRDLEINQCEFVDIYSALSSGRSQ